MERIPSTTLRLLARRAAYSLRSTRTITALQCCSPARRPLSTSTIRICTPRRSPQSLCRISQRRLESSTSTSSSSSIQGTIGKGEAGIRDEVARTSDALEAPEHLNEKEREIFDRLVAELSPVELDVQDISGGCGSMYGIQITSEKFRGLNMLKQQRLVNKVLGDEIKTWHGVQLRTKIP